MSCNKVLSIQNLCIQYQRGFFPIQDIGISIEKGKVFGLCGESGSGKSSVCKAVLGLLDNRSSSITGKIELMGKNILALSDKERRKINGKDIAFIMQNPMSAFDPCVKIKHHFIESLTAHLLCSKKDAAFYGGEMLEQVGLMDVGRIMNSYPHALSGGMLQRVMIAIAIALNPILIVADEPTTALDVESERTVIELLQWIVKKHSPAVLFVSHDIKVLSALAHDIAVMKDGKILEIGSAIEVFKNPQHDYTKELLSARNFMQEAEIC